MNLALKLMNLALKLMNLALKMMNLVFKTMGFVFKMIGPVRAYRRAAQQRGARGERRQLAGLGCGDGDRKERIGSCRAGHSESNRQAYRQAHWRQSAELPACETRTGGFMLGMMGFYTTYHGPTTQNW